MMDKHESLRKLLKTKTKEELEEIIFNAQILFISSVGSDKFASTLILASLSNDPKFKAAAEFFDEQIDFYDKEVKQQIQNN